MLSLHHLAPLRCRDLKSSNVLLATDGSTAKLADFGSAVLVGAATSIQWKRLPATSKVHVLKKLNT